jgi:hypothetical protein
MSASYRFRPRAAAPRPSAVAFVALLAGVMAIPALAQALVRNPLTGEMVEELPPRPLPRAAPRLVARGVSMPVPGGLYGTDGANLFLINKTTGVATFLGAHGIPPAEFAIGSLGFGSDGELYGISLTDAAKLYRIDPTTGAATAVGGPLGLEFILEGGLDFVCNAARAGNELDGIDYKTFTVNLATGAGTRVGPASGETRDLNGIAYDGSKLWAIDRFTNGIGTLDFATGDFDDSPVQVTVGGSPISIGDFGGLAADPTNGTVYAAFGSTGGLYTLNPTTGAATLIAVNDVDFGLAFAPIPATPTPTPSPTKTPTPIPTPTPTPPAPLDHFLLYKAKTTSGTPKLPSFGPVTLTDVFGTFQYDVKKMRRLGPPADKNNEGINDENTHLTEYQIRPSRGAPKFQGGQGVTVRDQFGNRTLGVKKPDALLVPTNKSFTSFPPDPTQATHNVDHFLCYKVVGPSVSELVTVEDQFEDRSYELKKLTRLCVPVAKSGSPTVRSGPTAGAPFPITPSTVRNDERLLCYKAVSTTGRHTKRNGLFLTNQFGDWRVDTVKEFELCVPSIEPVSPTPTPTKTPTPTPTTTPTPTGPVPCQTPSPTPVYGSVSKAFLSTSASLLD